MNLTQPYLHTSHRNRIYMQKLITLLFNSIREIFRLKKWLFSIKFAINILRKSPSALVCLASFSTPTPTAQAYDFHPKGPFTQTATHSQQSVLREGTGDQTDGLQRGWTVLAGGTTPRQHLSHGTLGLFPLQVCAHSVRCFRDVCVSFNAHTHRAAQTQWVWLHSEGSRQISHPENGWEQAACKEECFVSSALQCLDSLQT